MQGTLLVSQVWSGCFTILGALDSIRSSAPSRGRVTLFNLQPALRVLPRKNPFLFPFCPYHDLRFYFIILNFCFQLKEKRKVVFTMLYFLAGVLR